MLTIVSFRDKGSALGLKRSVLAPCSICFLKDANYKGSYGSSGLKNIRFNLNQSIMAIHTDHCNTNHKIHVNSHAKTQSWALPVFFNFFTN